MSAYKIRPNKTRTYLDIVHAEATPGSGAIVRVPVRSGREKDAEATAETLMNFMNERDRCLNTLQGRA